MKIAGFRGALSHTHTVPKRTNELANSTARSCGPTSTATPAEWILILGDYCEITVQLVHLGKGEIGHFSLIGLLWE